MKQIQLVGGYVRGRCEKVNIKKILIAFLLTMAGIAVFILFVCGLLLV